MLTTNKPIDVDRPDVLREVSNESLSFKEVRDSLVKFLMVAGVPFSTAKRLSVPINFSYKEPGQVEKSKVSLAKHVSYRATLVLEGLTVDGQKVHIVAVPFKLEDLSHSERNKILSIQRMFKVILFDERDWIKLGLDISDKQWLKPLLKGTLKSWARLLFKKISELEGEIQSEYTLNTLLHNIDRNVSRNGKVITRDNYVENLKTRLMTKELELRGYSSLSKQQLKVLKEIVGLESASVRWVEDLADSIIRHCITKVDLSQKVYRESFRQKNGKISLANPEAFSQLVYDYISANKHSLKAKVTGSGIVQIQDSRTFQTATFVFKVTTSTRGLGQVTLDTSNCTSTTHDLGFLLELSAVPKRGSQSNKVKEIGASIFKFQKSKSLKLNKADRLETLSSIKEGFYLWSDVL